MLKSNCKIMQNDKNGRIEEMVKMEEMVEMIEWQNWQNGSNHRNGRMVEINQNAFLA